jgi:nitroreductase
MTVKLLTLALMLGLLTIAAPAQAQEPSLKLAPPDFEAQGPTVLQALKNRKSDRVFADRELSLQHLSEVLWAAGGVNRPKLPNGGVGRTAPTARNLQAIEIFALTKDGVYHYDHQAHELKLRTGGDNRAGAGTQAYVAAAPLNLIYVVDLGKLQGGGEEKIINAALDAGHISENVYLYCASAGLNAIARISFDPAVLAPLLKTDKNYLPLLAQTVGYPN